MSDDGSPTEDGRSSANLTAARFPKGKSGNPGGRPKDLPRFRAACRGKGMAWLEQLNALMLSKLTRPDEKLAIWKAVCDRGGYLSADKAFAHKGDGSGGFVPPGDAPPPANVTSAVDAAVRALAAQVSALQQQAQLRALDAQEQRLLEAVAQRLADIEASRMRLLIDALKSKELNKDAGRTLTEMFGGKRLPRAEAKPEEGKPEEPKP